MTEPGRPGLATGRKAAHSVMADWKPIRKPPPTLCPGAFCFHWREAGSLVAPGLWGSLDEALRNLQPVERSGCGWRLSRCKRLDPLEGNWDAYEPHEPLLEEHGLPWFYFVPGPHKLAEESREAYVRESEALWGPRHWQD